MRRREIPSKWLIPLTLVFTLLATALWGTGIQGQGETRAANIDCPAESSFVAAVTGVITVENADSIWQTGFTTPPRGLIDAASHAPPRVIIEYANSIYHRDLESPPPSLTDVASDVGPRILIEYANSVCHYGLQEPFVTNNAPTCVIELRKQGTNTQIDKVDVGQLFDIYVEDSTDDIGIEEVRFLRDDSQDGIPTGEWTKWYGWDTSSGDWNATTKIKPWSFATGGHKEAWAELKDGSDNTAQCHANIFAHPGYAIIVAGYGIGKCAIDHGANNAYKVLRNLGFDDEHILYLNNDLLQDADGDGDPDVDWAPSGNGFELAMGWARLRVGEHNPFILYLVGHGEEDEFYLGSGIANSLFASDLNQELDKLEGTPMLIVIDSCYSGSFITSSEGISARDRTIITATHDRQDRSIVGCVRSGDRFWGNLNKGLNVKDAFIMNTWWGERQHVWLDDNGDRQACGPEFLVQHPPKSEDDEGWLAANTQIGMPDTEDLELTWWVWMAFRSPGEVRVYDSQNRVTGLVNGEVKEEIPNSMYDEENEIVAIFSPSDTHRYQVVGTEEETYGLDIASIEGAESTEFNASDIPTTSGAVHQYTIDWQALAAGEAGVTIEKDSDGDGEFEETIVTSQPNMPTNPSPANHAPSVSIDTDLSWVGGDPDAGDMVTYDVYFGTNSSPPFRATIGPYPATQSSITYDPSTLVDGTTYYWQIVARDNHGITREGPVWHFATGDLSQGEPSPELGFASLIAEGKLVIAYNFDPFTTVPTAVAGWTWFDPTLPPAQNNLAKLSKYTAYWVKVTEECWLTYGTQTYHLAAGWNNPVWLGC